MPTVLGTNRSKIHIVGRDLSSLCLALNVFLLFNVNGNVSVNNRFI